MRARLRSSVFKRFAAGAEGVAATEFALIVPILVALTVLMSDVGQAAVSAMNMQAAVRAAIQYAMNGGSDMTVAKSVGLNAWDGAPSGASFSSSESCFCGSAGATCGTACADGSLQKVFVTATAVAPVGGSVIHFTKETTQTVQVK
jgi:Flp pilus assembly protein TadG